MNLIVRRLRFTARIMKRNFLPLIFIALLFSANQTYGQKIVDGVIITGDVTDVTFCDHKDDTWIYDLKIRLHAKNVNNHPVIISSAGALIYYYKTAISVENLKAVEFIHNGWVTSGSRGDPKSIPDKPVKPFKVIASNDSIDIATDLRLILFREPKYGTTFLQVVAENWPDYSKEYIAKIRTAWSSKGALWEHSLHSEPISFMFPSNLKETHCQ